MKLKLQEKALKDFHLKLIDVLYERKLKSFISNTMKQMKTKRVYSEAENKEEPKINRLSIVKDYEHSLAVSKAIKEPILCHHEEGNDTSNNQFM